MGRGFRGGDGSQEQLAIRVNLRPYRQSKAYCTGVAVGGGGPAVCVIYTERSVSRIMAVAELAGTLVGTLSPARAGVAVGPAVTEITRVGNCGKGSGVQV